MNQGRQLYMHRVIWKWVTGADANETLDHKNQIRDDNRFENLAPASFLEQSRNRSSVVLNPDKVRQIRHGSPMVSDLARFTPTLAAHAKPWWQYRKTASGRTWPDYQI